MGYYEDIIFNQKEYNMLKEMYNDYMEMVVKPEKEFYKKHLLGSVLINAVPITVLLMVPTILRSLVVMQKDINQD